MTFSATSTKDRAPLRRMMRRHPRLPRTALRHGTRVRTLVNSIGRRRSSRPNREAQLSEDRDDHDGDGGKRMRFVGALAVVDEDLTFGQTLKNRDVSTMDEQLVVATKAKELDKLRRFNVFTVVDADVGIVEMRR